MVPTSAGAVRVLSAGPDGGPTVFMAADPPLGLEHYTEVVAALLAARLRVLICELPGFGFSAPSPSFDWSLEAYAEAFEALLAEAGAREVVLAPSCFTALPALQWARARPERVAGFVGIQAPSWPDAVAWMRRNDPVGVRPGLPNGIFGVPGVGQVLNWVGSDVLERGWLGRAEPDRERRRELERVRVARRRHGCLYCLASGLQATLRDDPFGATARKTLDCPSALLWGAADRSHRPTSPASFARYLKAPAVHVVEGAGHFPELTAPAMFVTALSGVLRGAEARR
jgi:pimeloyl-ACP methyl ester carboxylesterase